MVHYILMWLLWQHSIISHLYENKEEMLSAAIAMASLIASKSPVAVASTKHNLIYSRDHPVDDALSYMVRMLYCIMTPVWQCDVHTNDWSEIGLR